MLDLKPVTEESLEKALEYEEMLYELEEYEQSENEFGTKPHHSPQFQAPSLALRRHHNARIKKKRSHYTSVSGSSVYNERAIGRGITTPANCSCLICSNPRRTRGTRTIQEQRQMQDDFEEELNLLQSA